MLIGGDQKMILYNDLEPTEKIKIYDTGYNHKSDEEKKRILVDYRTGDIHVPKLNTTRRFWEWRMISSPQFRKKNSLHLVARLVWTW